MSEFLDNKSLRRFELACEGALVFATYSRAEGVVAIDHVETPVALRGRGHAGRLMEAIMAVARAEGFKVRPICPFAAAHLKRRPEHRDLIG